MATAILDIDGTLVDTNYQHALAWYRAFRQHEIVLPVWRIHRHIGITRGPSPKACLQLSSRYRAVALASFENEPSPSELTAVTL